MLVKTLLMSLVFVSLSLGETTPKYNSSLTPIKVVDSSDLNLQATRNANLAMKVATANGIQHPEIFVGLLKVETQIGTYPGFRVTKYKKSTYYGIGQFTIATAEQVAKQNNIRYRDKWQLAKRLANDDKFAMDMSAKYLMMLGINKSADKAITSYNLGAGGAKGIAPMSHPYTRDVFSAAKKIKQDIKTIYVTRSNQ